MKKKYFCDKEKKTPRLLLILHHNAWKITLTLRAHPEYLQLRAMGHVKADVVRKKRKSRKRK